MSKSKRNGVDPQALIEEYGADTARFFMMFASPPEQTLEWSDSGVEGAYRFLKRVWAFGHAPRQAPGCHGQDARSALRREIHLLLKQANYDLGKLQFNTVASAAMKMLNALEKAPGRRARAREGFSILLRLLSPITPHICHALWRELGYRRRHPRRALARAARRSAGAGRNRTGAAGQRQAARQHPRTGRRRPGGHRSRGARL